MKLTKQLRRVMVAAAILSLGAVGVRAQNQHYMTAITCGNWNSAGIHDPTTLYQIGYNLEHPNEQAAYFEFDLDSVKGKTVTGAGLTVPGSTDFSITTDWTGHPAGEQTNQFKVGIPPMCSTNASYVISLSTILTSSSDSHLWVNATDAGRNQDLGYAWVMTGFHFGQEFGMFTYNTQRLQYAVSQGGNYVFWAVDRFDNGAGGENYIWGSTSYNTNIILRINTSN